MGVITKELFIKTADKLKQNIQFTIDSRALTGTVLFQDTKNSVYMSFYRGKLIEVEEGHCIYGSDYRIYASEENWRKALLESNPAYGIYELAGKLLEFDGNMYMFSGNAKAFYILWLTLAETYRQLAEGGGTADDR